MNWVIILHHHEITLKGDNRGYFERHLMRNIRGVLADLIPSLFISGGYGRSIIEIPAGTDRHAVAQRLTYVFGVANICTGVRTDQNIASFCRMAEELLRPESFRTIKVETRRPDKRFPIRSMEVSSQVGEHLCTVFDVRADMKNPDQKIHIEIVNGVAYIYGLKIRGGGGLPVGVSGRIVALLSAGFDSPVASWMMMRRGATVTGVHFHSMPYTGRQSVDQVRRICEQLVRYQSGMKLFLVPFADLQQEIVLHSPMPLRVILYRRMMIRIACAIAKREQAEGLVTGESIGQVASQTLRNIRVIDDVAELPVFRPLSGTDKEETMAVARTIGTYDLSKEPYDDCCSFLAPRKPETWADPAEVIHAEEHFDISAMVQRALDATQVEHFSYPVQRKQAVEATPAAASPKLNVDVPDNGY
jgi:thiamine biosynthesis protein ThiI